MSPPKKTILITGANGFIGKNLSLRLSELEEFQVLTFNRSQSFGQLKELVNGADAIVHLAGVNRPDSEDLFETDNVNLTKTLCDMIVECRTQKHLIFASSTHSQKTSAYGISKRKSEVVIEEHLNENFTETRATIYRLPGVFGKWCRPNYNSVVATFCYNTINDIELNVEDERHTLPLVYIDDVIDAFISDLKKGPLVTSYRNVTPEYEVSVGELAKVIKSFKHVREHLIVSDVGIGLKRALHATYLSYLRPDEFAYPLLEHKDERGCFVEFLKTETSGQFSFFTAEPGVTRGGHYHNSKTEKFLVIKGKANFKFRSMLTGETHTLNVNSNVPTVVETIPGWAHDITNTGKGTLIVLLWANEIFKPEIPDTFNSLV